MESIDKFELEVELKSPSDALWNTVKDLNILYTKLFPDIFKNVDIVKVDGTSAATYRVIDFVSDKYGMGKTQKSKIEFIDDEKKAVAYLTAEGRPMKLYKYYHELITVKENGEGSLVVWTCSYTKKIRCLPGPELMKDTMIDIFHKLDAYTLAKL